MIATLFSVLVFAYPYNLVADDLCSESSSVLGTCKVAVVADNHAHKDGHDDEKKHDHKESEDSHDHGPKGKENSESHAQDEHGKNEKKHAHDEHEKGEEKHAPGEGEHEDEHGSSQVGPDKGVVEASPEKGFKLSKQATKQFDLKFVSVRPDKSVQLPSTAIVHTGEEKNIYRLRDGFIKRIDFKVLSKSGSSLSIQSSDLNANDQVVVEGLGFLRIAEITTFDGAPEGHAH